jgi:hypothetical protein
MKTTSLSFFDPVDIEELAPYGGKAYRKSPQALRVGQQIFSKIARKTKFWAQSVVVDGYQAFPSMHWQVMGQFMKYSWARIHKPEDLGRGIYFTVGVSFTKKVLEYKLDCQRKVPARNAKHKIELTPDQIQLFDDLVQGSGAEGYEIDISEINQLDWPSLVKETEEFVHLYNDLYARAIEAVWNKHRATRQTGGHLTVDGSDVIPPKEKSKRKFRFKPRKTDYSHKGERLKQIGDRGERIVVGRERAELRKVGRRDLAKRVTHVSRELGDGAGYDIGSFELDGSDKFIEVKTTLGSIGRGFMVSMTELQFSKEHAGQFYLYRVYELDENKGTGRVHLTKGALDNHFALEPILYEATFQKP